jgi:hypothetical protein
LGFPASVSVSAVLQARNGPIGGEDRLAAWLSAHDTNGTNVHDLILGRTLQIRGSSDPPVAEFEATQTELLRNITRHLQGGAELRVNARISAGTRLEGWVFRGCSCRVHIGLNGFFYLKESGTVWYRHGEGHAWVEHHPLNNHAPLILERGTEIELEVGGLRRQFNNVLFSSF